MTDAAVEIQDLQILTLAEASRLPREQRSFGTEALVVCFSAGVMYVQGAGAIVAFSGPEPASKLRILRGIASRALRPARYGGLQYALRSLLEVFRKPVLIFTLQTKMFSTYAYLEELLESGRLKSAHYVAAPSDELSFYRPNLLGTSDGQIETRPLHKDAVHDEALLKPRLVAEILTEISPSVLD